MNTVLQIGAGGVGGVVAHKMAMNRDVFHRIILSSRNINKCEAIANSIEKKGLGKIEISSCDASKIDSIIKLINFYNPNLVINVALPYHNLNIMEACLQTGTHYLDTANYEHLDSAHFEYKEQWAFDKKYKDAGIFALLGSGFDPGVTNVFCGFAAKHYFDEIHEIDILDCNAGDHGYAFATNFNPEINLREVSSIAKFWSKEIKECNDLKKDGIYRKFEREKKHFEYSDLNLNLENKAYFDGFWINKAPLELMKVWDYPHVGEKNSYLLYHEELESLIRNIKGLKRIRFFMTFGESYLTHMKCLENVGLLRIDEVNFNGNKIIPMQFLKSLLPDPSTLAPLTKGLTNIGCYIKGIKNSKERIIYIYNICNHEKCFKEVNSQAISYTTGVPAMIGAKLILEKKWGVDTPKIQNNANNLDMPKGGETQGIDLAKGAGVWNMEQNDPDPFMEELSKQGLDFEILEIDENGDKKILKSAF